ncbi:MAG TPA: DUF3467 domain-containing protein [Elusimicrobiales bacterium]|nr:DUF3467 domain-containing protein [Elusimicrobiales bacterium]
MKPFKFSKKNREYIKWDKNHKEVRVFPKKKAEPVQPGPAAASAAPAASSAPDDGAAAGIYANMAVVTNTETEFLLDFLFLCPGQSKAKVLARVISNPAGVRRLCAALRENIKQYEARFGPVKE